MNESHSLHDFPITLLDRVSAKMNLLSRDANSDNDVATSHDFNCHKACFPVPDQQGTVPTLFVSLSSITQAVA